MFELSFLIDFQLIHMIQIKFITLLALLFITHLDHIQQGLLKYYAMNKKLYFRRKGKYFILNYEKVQKQTAKQLRRFYQIEMLNPFQEEQQLQDQDLSPLLMHIFNNKAGKFTRSSKDKPIQHHDPVQYVLSTDDARKLILKAIAVHISSLQNRSASGENQRGQLFQKNQELEENRKKIQRILIPERNVDFKLEEDSMSNSSSLNTSLAEQSSFFIHPFQNRSGMTLEQEAAISYYIRHFLIKLDKKVFEDTIICIQQDNLKANCKIILEQSYPPLKMSIQTIKSYIGQEAYHNAVNIRNALKQEQYKNSVSFKDQHIFMCHLCEQVDLINPQGFSDEQFYLCKASPKQEITCSPLASYEIGLKIRYDNIEKIYANKMDNSSFDNCYYPYHKSFGKECKRLVCEKCRFSIINRQFRQKRSVIKVEEDDCWSSDENQKQKTKNRYQLSCLYCAGICECQKCQQSKNFNFLMSLFIRYNGDYQQIKEQLLFLNMEKYIDKEVIDNNFEEQNHDRDQDNQPFLPTFQLGEINRKDNFGYEIKDYNDCSAENKNIFEQLLEQRNQPINIQEHYQKIHESPSDRSNTLKGIIQKIRIINKNNLEDQKISKRKSKKIKILKKNQPKAFTNIIKIIPEIKISLMQIKNPIIQDSFTNKIEGDNFNQKDENQQSQIQQNIIPKKRRGRPKGYKVIRKSEDSIKKVKQQPKYNDLKQAYLLAIQGEQKSQQKQNVIKQKNYQNETIEVDVPTEMIKKVSIQNEEKQSKQITDHQHHKESQNRTYGKYLQKLRQINNHPQIEKYIGEEEELIETYKADIPFIPIVYDDNQVVTETEIFNYQKFSKIMSAVNRKRQQKHSKENLMNNSYL